MTKKIILLTSFLLFFLVGCSDKAISLSGKSFIVDEGDKQAIANFSDNGYATVTLNQQEIVSDYEVFTEQYEGYDGIVIDGDYYLAEQKDDVVYLWTVTENFSIDEEDDYFFEKVGNIEEVDMKLTENKD